jgi:hypothetical protein
LHHLWLLRHFCLHHHHRLSHRSHHRLSILHLLNWLLNRCMLSNFCFLFLMGDWHITRFKCLESWENSHELSVNWNEFFINFSKIVTRTLDIYFDVCWLFSN